MPVPQKPKRQFVANGWWLELPGLVSPHFETIGGIEKSTGTVTIVDAGTNIRYKFASQIVDYGEITLTRTYDGSSDDVAFEALVDSSIELGLKHSGVLIKREFRLPVFSLGFDGIRFTNKRLPDLATDTEEKFTATYTATVDVWAIV